MIENQLASNLEMSQSTFRSNKNYSNRITVKHANRVLFVPTSEITHIQADGNYVKIHTQKKSYLIRSTLKKMLAKLNPEIFYQIHRSTIVNIQQVRELQPYFHGDYIVYLNNGVKLNMSRNFKGILS